MKKLINAILVLVAAAILVYMYMPTVNFGFTGFAMLLMVLIGVWTLLNNPFSITQGANNQPTLKLGKPGKTSFILLGILAVYIFVVPVFTSWPIFHTEEYRSLIGKVETESNL